MNEFLSVVLLHLAGLGLVAIVYTLRLRAAYGRWTFPADEVPPFAFSYLGATAMGLILLFSTEAKAIPLLGGFLAVNGMVLLSAYLINRSASASLRSMVSLS